MSKRSDIALDDEKDSIEASFHREIVKFWFALWSSYDKKEMRLIRIPIMASPEAHNRSIDPPTQL
jgi:hypothetical protein